MLVRYLVQDVAAALDVAGPVSDVTMPRAIVKAILPHRLDSLGMTVPPRSRRMCTKQEQISFSSKTRHVHCVGVDVTVSRFLHLPCPWLSPGAFFSAEHLPYTRPKDAA